jgi:predicted AAA+ superfamily ATPase
LRRYLNLLDQTYQFDLLKPFSTNLAKRLVKTYPFDEPRC